VLQELPKPTVTSMRNLDWFLAHFDELVERYPGEWLAIQDDEVIAHDLSAEALGKKIRAMGPVRVFITRAHPDAWLPYK
jgi:hypothetical protein